VNHTRSDCELVSLRVGRVRGVLLEEEVLHVLLPRRSWLVAAVVAAATKKSTMEQGMNHPRFKLTPFRSLE
jgi:hypothetical protein